jgi:hypothetical protein
MCCVHSWVNALFGHSWHNFDNKFFISTTYTQYRVKGYKQAAKNESNTYTNNNYHTQTNKKDVSQYNKCNKVPPVLSSKDRLIKEPKDFTCCEEVGLRIFSILSISWNSSISYTIIMSSWRQIANVITIKIALSVRQWKIVSILKRLIIANKRVTFMQ